MTSRTTLALIIALTSFGCDASTPTSNPEKLTKQLGTIVVQHGLQAGIAHLEDLGATPISEENTIDQLRAAPECWELAPPEDGLQCTKCCVISPTEMACASAECDEASG